MPRVFLRDLSASYDARLKLHPSFRRASMAVHRVLPRALVVMDGRYGLGGIGPMRGDPVTWPQQRLGLTRGVNLEPALFRRKPTCAA